MSSILKALKKLEDENNARTPDALKINAEILRGGESQRISTTGIILGALFLFLGGGAAAYLLMQPGTHTTARTHTPAAQTTDRPPAATQLPQVPAALSSQHQQPEMPEKSTSSPSSTIHLKPARNKSLPRVVTAPHPLTPAASHRPEPPDSPIVSARPVVRVNGIAFQDGSDSVAVINGVAVSRGALVEGARIDEIRPDRVQFSYGGEKFEVLLGKSNQ